MIFRSEQTEYIEYTIQPCWDLDYKLQYSSLPDKQIKLVYLCSQICYQNNCLNQSLQNSGIKIAVNPTLLTVTYDKTQFSSKLIFCKQPHIIFPEINCTTTFNVDIVKNTVGTYFFSVQNNIGLFETDYLVFQNSSSLDITSTRPNKLLDVDSIDYPYNYYGQNRIPFYHIFSPQFYLRKTNIENYFYKTYDQITYNQIQAQDQQLLFKSKLFKGVLNKNEVILEDNKDSIIKIINQILIIQNKRLNLTQTQNIDLANYTDINLKFNNKQINLVNHIFMCSDQLKLCRGEFCKQVQFKNGHSQGLYNVILDVDNFLIYVTGYCPNFQTKYYQNYSYLYKPISSLKKFRFTLSTYSILLISSIPLAIVWYIILKVIKYVNNRKLIALDQSTNEPEIEIPMIQ